MSRPDDCAEHPEAALLPWYLSGTLDAEEAQAVERHLAGCAECRRARDEWLRLRTALGRVVESRPGPPPTLFASVLARIDAAERAPARAAAARGPWWERAAAAVFGMLPPRLAPAAALAVIVLQLGLLAGLGTVAYRTIGGPVAVTQSAPEGGRPPLRGAVRLRVAFEDGATARAGRVMLQRLEARIVAGPSAAGFYTVEAPASVEGRPAADVLRSYPAVVRFVEETR